MREILFRGKEIDSGKWAYGNYYYEAKNQNTPYYITWNGKDALGDFGDRYNPINNVIVEPETIGQYIGRTDKYGTKIFEGDIIKVRTDTDFYGKPITFKGVVFFNEDECGFEIGKNGMKGYCISSLASYIFKSSATEIIGNFYDNPELLEE